MLQPSWLKYHAHTIGIDQSLRNNDIYEQKCLKNIKILYKQSGKGDDQQKFQDILEADMVYTPKGFTDNSPISPMKSTSIKKPSAQKSLCLFTNILDMKKIPHRRVGASKSKRKSIKFGNIPWTLKQKRKANSKMDEQTKKYFYNWIIHHPKVAQSTIFNDCLKVKIDAYTEPQLVSKLLLQVSIG